MPTAAYTAAKAKALAVVAEVTVGGTSIALLHMRRTGNRYRIVTSGGGSEIICTEQAALRSFNGWVRAIGTR